MSEQLPGSASTLPTRAERLNRLPFGREHGKLLVGSGIGWALDAMDVGLISYVMAALAATWKLENTQLSWIGSIGFVGMMIGASVGGLLADRLGRRNVFALTLLVYGLATGAAAFSTGIAMLIVLRFIVGLGLGANCRWRPPWSAVRTPASAGGWSSGWRASGSAGSLPRCSATSWCRKNRWLPGWRWALLVIVRRSMPGGAPGVARVGALLESKAAWRRPNARCGCSRALQRRSGPEFGLPSANPAQHRNPRRSRSSPVLRKRTIALWSVWFFVNLSYYGAFTWLPTLLFRQGHSLVRSFEYTLIAPWPSYPVTPWPPGSSRSGDAVDPGHLPGFGVAAGLFGLRAPPPESCWQAWLSF